MLAHITTYWAWRWVAIFAMSALCQIWGPITLGQHLIRFPFALPDRHCPISWSLSWQYSFFLVSSQVLKTMWSCGREFVQTDLNNMEYSWKLAHWIDLATIYFPILLAIFPELSQPIILTEQRRLRLPFPHWPWAGQAFNLDQSEASIYKLFRTCCLKFPK